MQTYCLRAIKTNLWLGLALVSFYVLAVCLKTRAGPSGNQVHSATHSIRGRIFLSSPNASAPLKVSLSSAGEGNAVAKEERLLGYDRAFLYDHLTAGNYLLTIESQDLPTIARPIELKDSPTPRTVFLNIRLAGDGAATIQEVVKDSAAGFEQEETPTQVPKKALQAFQKAAEESAKGNSAPAIGYLKKAIAEEPNYFEAYNNLGVQYQKLKRWEEAIEAFSKAIATRDHSAKPHINLGIIYLNLNQPDSAIQQYRRALELDMNSVPAHLGLGQALLQKKDYSAVEEHLETATRLDPRGTRQAFVLLIQIEILNKRYAQARYFLNVALDFFPDDPEFSNFSQSLNYLSHDPAVTPQP
jgi:tetratricopeptide (TPR) repeat protein